MPRLVRRSEQPDDVQAAIGVFGNSGHTAILKFLAENGSSLRAAILEGTELNQATLGHHLEALEQYGAVTGNIPPGSRKGRTVMYSLDKERIKTLWDAHLSYIMDTEPDPTREQK
ncbi:ArsR/SmtB family transcription factor [Arthrobacter pigmenti]